MGGIENRLRERHKYDKHILCFECVSGDPIHRVKIPFLFTVNDISYGGMGILCKHLIPPESVMRFRLTEDEHARVFSVKVAWCKYDGELYHMGVSFKDIVREDVVFLYELIHNLE